MDQDNPQPNDNQPPPHQQPPHQQPPPAPGMAPGMVYPEESQAVLSLVLSIIGLVACGGLLCPVGWHLGNKELAGIDAGRRDPSKRDMAQAGKIIGIIGTVLVALAIVATVGFVVLALVLGAATS